MWNPFLTAEERASIRRGGEFMRRSSPLYYWSARSFIVFCAIGCVAVLIFLLAIGAYANVLALLLLWSGVYLASSWLAAWSIRRDS